MTQTPREVAHQVLDNLIAEYILDNYGSMPSKITTLELMEWNHKKIKEEEKNKPLTVKRARELRICRFCREKDSPKELDNSFVLDYGKEYAHRKCIDKFHSNQDLITKI